MSKPSNGPEPEIIPPGQKSKQKGESASRGFDGWSARAEGLARHPMTWSRVAYVLYALSLVTGVPMLVGLILAYVARGEAPPWLQSHYTFLIRTFWYLIVLLVVGGVLAVFVVGLVLLWVLPLWVAVRVFRGWLLLENQKPVPDPESWLFG